MLTAPRRAAALSAALACCLIVVPCPRADAQPRAAPPLSEIVVTARKREEDLARVPASVLVAGRERLAAHNLNRLDELAEFAPGLAASDTGIGTQLSMRGVASGNNPAFEQSVAQYLDGVHYGRAPLTALPFLDLERVEVLRGPQGILFGKNALAGALNLVSARPVEERELSLRGLYEFSARQREHEAVLSGPAGPVLARLAWRGSREAGYLENGLSGRREAARREDALRLTLRRDLAKRTTATLKLEGGNHRSRGKAIEIVRDEPNRWPAGSSPLAGLDLAASLAVLGLPAMESQLDLRRQADEGRASTRVRNATLHLVHRAEAFRLSAVSAMLGYEVAQHCDCDFTPAPLLEARLHERYHQVSQELRLQSSVAGPLEWIVGAYFHGSELEAGDILAIPTHSPLALLAGGAEDAGAPVSLAALPGSAAARRNHQESRAFALFLQGSWEFIPGWRLTLGGRHTRETREARRTLDLWEVANQAPREDPALAQAYRNLFGIHSRQLDAGGHDRRGRRKEAQFAPLLRLERDLDRATLYATATKGYKGGGFDARANNPASFEFRAESVDSLELGFRSRWLDGRLELGGAVFDNHHRDLQVSQFDGGVGFNVGNARGARSRGVELEGRWALGRDLTLDYAWSWLDFAYTDFRNGNCAARRVPDGDIVGGVPLCDYTGQPGKYAPRQRLSLGLEYRRSLGAAILLASASFNRRGAQQVHDNLDPAFRVAPAWRFNLRLGLQSGPWSIALLGRNLGGVKELTHAGNVPMAAALFGVDAHYARVARPRQLALEAGRRFGP